MFKYELGLYAKDKVSGYEGILNARMEFYKGPIRYLLQAKVGEDGKEIEAITIDEDAVELLDKPGVERKYKDLKFKYELGSKVKDSITGYKGILSSRTEWLFGCMRYVIQSPEFHEGKPVAGYSVDEQSIEFIAEPKEKKKVEAEAEAPQPVKRTGGTGPKPLSHKAPERPKIERR